jgi:hypothetical protein
MYVLFDIALRNALNIFKRKPKGKRRLTEDNKARRTPKGRTSVTKSRYLYYIVMIVKDVLKCSIGRARGKWLIPLTTNPKINVRSLKRGPGKVCFIYMLPLTHHHKRSSDEEQSISWSESDDVFTSKQEGGMGSGNLNGAVIMGSTPERYGYRASYHR